MRAAVTINTINEDWANLSREIKAWQNQSGVDVQVIVSTVSGDTCIDRIAAEFPTVTVVVMDKERHPGKCPRGSFMQLNESLPYIDADWWCFASGNDFVYPNKLKDEIETAIRRKALVAYSDFNYVRDNGVVISRQRFGPYQPKAHEHTNIIPDCSLIHRSIVDRFLPFNTDLNNYAYWDLWLRVRNELGNGIFARTMKVGWGYRQGDGDMHKAREKSAEQKAHAMIDRDRMLSMHGLGKVRVVNFTIEDHANYAFDNARALRAVGVNARAIKLRRHPFGYTEQADIVTIAEAQRICRQADVVQVFFNIESHKAIDPALKGKKVVMYYAGTEFRVNKQRYDTYFKRKGVKTIIALPEFRGHGDYLSVTVDTDAITPNGRKPTKPFVVGHYPSNPEVKGTETIRRTLADVSNVVLHIDTAIIPYADSLKRMESCDIYVELFAPTNHGQPYGSFGTTAIEAAAMGKVVITMDMNPDIYREAYGECPLILVNTEAELREEVERLSMLSVADLCSLQNKFRQWAVSCHGYSAQGKRIAQIVA